MNTNNPSDAPENKAIEPQVDGLAESQPVAESTPNTEDPKVAETTPTEPTNHSHKFLYILISILFVLILIIIGAFIYFSPISSQNDSSQTTQHNILQLKGEVVIVEGVVEKQVLNDQWESVKMGDTIETGDVLRTGADSRVVVNLDDGSAVRIDQNSSLAFTNLSNKTITLTQVAGRAFHRVQKGELVYAVKSLDTTATALGTSFSTITNTNEAISQVVVLESKVKVASSHIEQDVQVEQGSYALVDNKKHQINVDTIDPKTLDEEFYKWNSALNEGKDYVKPTPTPTPTPNPTQAQSQEVSSLSLSATPIAGGAKLTWTVSGLDTSKGFKIIKASHNNPTFGKDHANYDSNPAARSYEWTGLDAKQYYFRIGVYNGEGISWYSNVVSITPSPKTKKTTSAPFTGAITLSHVMEDGKVKLNWSATNTETVHGWKLVYSTSPNPTYPDDSPIFIETKKSSYTLAGLKSGKTYYVRVGAWIDSNVASNAYSNQVAIVVP